MSTAIHTLVENHRKYQSSIIEGQFPLDHAVIEQLPPGTQVIDTVPHGSSSWTVTARISTILADGTPKQWFLKCATEDEGRVMMEGEFHSAVAIYKTVPSFVPKPHAWGKFHRSHPETYFFLSDFVEMEDGMPDPVQFCSRLAELHKSSISPNGCFGFPVTTNQGKFPQAVGWERSLPLVSALAESTNSEISQASWQSFFCKLLQNAIAIDAQENGPWSDLSTISSHVITSVIPLLLGPLETNGRTVKPSLIHGDLWDGNIGTNYETGDVYIFDAGAYYAHNEMELGMWRCKRHRLVNNKIYLGEYLRNAGMSEPVEQFDDRNRLYCVYMNIWASAHHAGGIDRTTAYNDMCYLVNKYAPAINC